MKKYFLLLLTILSITFVNSPKLLAKSSFCSQLDGLKLYSNETKPQYLGTFSSDKYDSESIANQYGNYGSKYESDSIFNQYGDYGSKYNSYSPWNKYTSTAPYLVDDDNDVVAVLTVNTSQSGAVNTMEALSCVIDLSDDRLTPFLADNPVNNVKSGSTGLTCPVGQSSTVDWKLFSALSDVPKSDAENRVNAQLLAVQTNAENALKVAQQNLQYAQQVNNTADIANYSADVAYAQLKATSASQNITLTAQKELQRNLDLSTYCAASTTPTVPTVSQTVVSQSVFTDVLPVNTYYDAIKYLKANNIVSGYNDGTYRPSNQINRAEFTKIVIGSLGISGQGANCFSDVHNEWFATYICYAKTNSIIGGYNNGSFKPNQNINLAEALKIVILALKVNLSSNTGSNWYDVYVNTANENNLLNTINPDLKHEVTRGELAQIIYNIKTIGT